ncbi:MAG TPA: DNA-processing protein DprA, partial [Jatrophihabitans sp.]|nr:DNA-processing protein DprA [Jatrophihabitans sp.]
TVVVEAGRRSGALNTAGHAWDLGRPVLAVPGPVTSAMSVGCHRLLQRDERPAHLVTSVSDILEFCSLTRSAADPAGSAAVGAATSDSFAPAGSNGRSLQVDGAAPTDGSGAARSVQQATPRPPDALDAAARTVLDGFPAQGPVTETQLARLSGQPVSAVLAALPMLLAHGLVVGSREGYRLVRRPAGPR